jgi:hypothetical protein
MMKHGISCAGLLLAACQQGPDWRAKAMEAAETTIRSEIGDPAARFSQVQVTGDEAHGQTCGMVSATDAGGAYADARFIVYIDKGGGPWIDAHGRSPISADQFNFQWNADCVGEGWTGHNPS